MLRLARHFGSLLRYDVEVVDRFGDVSKVSDTPPVWDRQYGSPLARREALAGYAKSTFDFTPLDTIDLDLPLVGLKGVAFVLPTPVHPTKRSGHRVHLKGMLLSDSAQELVPDWAFFVSCVVDTTGLRPTASREALYEDETLAAVRDAIGERIREWLVRAGGLGPDAAAALHRRAPPGGQGAGPATTTGCWRCCCRGCRSRPRTATSAWTSSPARTPWCW